MLLLSNGQLSSIMFLLSSLLTLTLLLHSSTFACSCSGPDPTPCEAYGSADAVFIGRAIDGEERKEESGGGGKKWILLGGKVRFVVEQAFKGIYGNEVEVITWNGAQCGFGDFTKGERYLLYLNGDYNEGFRAHMCSGSTHISDASEDLKFLSGLASKTCGARLYGAVGNFEMDYVRDNEGRQRSVVRVYNAVPEITITARDKRGQILTAVTNREGAFEFTGILPGVEYTVRAELPGYFQKTPSSERKIQIGACGCGRINFPAFYDGSISGRITNPDGKPGAKAEIAIVRADDKVSRLKTQVSSATADKDGRFILEKVPPGNYVLGVNITVAPRKDSPYRPTWYPDAATRQEAKIIEVGPGEKLPGYDLVIPRRLAERTIEGAVFWPDGRPATDAYIYLSPSAQPGQGAGGELKSIYTDNHGRFKITGYEGIAYYVVASCLRNKEEPVALRERIKAEPPLVELKGENVTGLRLTLSWNEETLRDFFEKKRDQQK
jgi:Carboxypeptidase regulatory-like domain